MGDQGCSRPRGVRMGAEKKRAGWGVSAGRANQVLERGEERRELVRWSPGCGS